MFRILAAAAAAALSAGTASADIVIATAGPMTGQYASFGQQMRAGAETVFDDMQRLPDLIAAQG